MRRRNWTRFKERLRARYGLLVLGHVLHRLNNYAKKDRGMIEFVEGLMVGQRRKITRNGGKL